MKRIFVGLVVSALFVSFLVACTPSSGESMSVSLSENFICGSIIGVLGPDYN